MLALRNLYRKGKRSPSLAQALLAIIPSGGDTGTDVGSLPDGLYNLLTTTTRLPVGIATGTLLIVDSGHPSALWYVATRPGKKYTIVNPTTGQGLYNSNNAQLILKSPVDSDPRFLWEIAADGSWKSAGSSMSMYYGQGSRGTTVTLSPVGSPWSSTKLAAGVSERDPASSDSGPRGYTFCADEGGTCQFTSRASVAFGANGSFLYSDVTGPFNCSHSPGAPDPAPGVVKACYVAPATDDPFPGQVYQATACADESSSCTVAKNQSLAFGAQTANGWRFTYRSFDEAGTVPCTRERFGFDPAPGVPKRCYAGFHSGAQPPGPPGFALCAMRNETCSFVGTGAVAFGLAGRYTYKTATNGIPCTTASFGLDPVPGAIGPACYYRQTALPVLSYVKCADEGPSSGCTFSRNDQTYRVIFGAKGRYVSRTFSGVSSVLCLKSSFGNVDPIDEPKACYASALDLVYCAVEGGTCNVPSGAVMLFGAPTNDEGKTWLYSAKRVLPGNHDCNT